MQLRNRLLVAAMFLCTGVAAQAQSRIAVVVAADSTAGAVSREQVTAIFMGRSQQLPGAGRALPVDQSNDVLREQFNSKVLGKSSSQVKSIWSRLIFSGSASPPKEMNDSAAVKAYLASHPGAIGYIDASAVDSSVKVVLSVD
jgi:ABC-type phosphate transport system substrate-binding protein